MYEKWLSAPSSVHASWDAYFKTGDFQAVLYLKKWMSSIFFFQLPPVAGQPRPVTSVSVVRF